MRITEFKNYTELQESLKWITPKKEVLYTFEFPLIEKTKIKDIIRQYTIIFQIKVISSGYLLQQVWKTKHFEKIDKMDIKLIPRKVNTMLNPFEFSSKNELYEYLNKELKRIGFKENTNTELKDISNLEIEVAKTAKIQKYIELFLSSMDKDSFEEEERKLFNESFLLNSEDIQKILKEIEVIKERKNNEKFNNRHQRWDVFFSNKLREVSAKEEFDTLKKDKAFDFEYTGKNKVLRNYLEQSKKQLEDNTYWDIQDKITALEEYKLRRKLTSEYSHLLDQYIPEFSGKEEDLIWYIRDTYDKVHIVKNWLPFNFGASRSTNEKIINFYTEILKSVYKNREHIYVKRVAYIKTGEYREIESNYVTDKDLPWKIKEVLKEGIEYLEVSSNELKIDGWYYSNGIIKEIGFSKKYLLKLLTDAFYSKIDVFINKMFITQEGDILKTMRLGTIGNFSVNIRKQELKEIIENKTTEELCNFIMKNIKNFINRQGEEVNFIQIK